MLLHEIILFHYFFLGFPMRMHVLMKSEISYVLYTDILSAHLDGQIFVD